MSSLLIEAIGQRFQAVHADLHTILMSAGRAIRLISADESWTLFRGGEGEPSVYLSRVFPKIHPATVRHVTVFPDGDGFRLQISCRCMDLMPLRSLTVASTGHAVAALVAFVEAVERDPELLDIATFTGECTAAGASIFSVHGKTVPSDRPDLVPFIYAFNPVLPVIMHGAVPA